MVCHKALEALVSVVITGKVGFSAVTPMSSTMNVTAGDTMTLSFLIDKSAIVRNVVGQGIVMDGIAPFPVCTEDFKLSFSSGLRVYLGPPPVALDGTVGDFYFSLMKGRPVNDGAYFSTSPDKGSEGVPLLLHGAPEKEVFTGVFELRYKRHSIPSIEFPAAYGTYGQKGLLWSELKLMRDWMGNEIMSAHLETMTLTPAKA